ncbi:MAG: hypothetical protein DIU63_00445 [Proteobacteria bacterium]|nr:MAG: hypothetical protein DIU63_00445 [Pseudomonadota bacterium]
MIGRIVGLLVGFVSAVFLVTLAVANRHSVLLVLDPFNPQNPVLALELPFYAYLFAMLIIGVVLGGTATWMSQSRWRRLARARGQDAARWRAEAERLTRERDATLAAQRRASGQPSDARQLALASH